MAAAASAAQQPEGTRRLRISFEGKSYNVEVEILSATPTPDTGPEWAIPESVLAPPLQPDIRDEDRICRSPIAGAIVSVNRPSRPLAPKGRPGSDHRRDEDVQTAIGAPVEGIVKEVNVAKGDAVKPGQVLCKQA